MKMHGTTVKIGSYVLVCHFTWTCLSLVKWLW